MVGHLNHPMICVTRANGLVSGNTPEIYILLKGPQSVHAAYMMGVWPRP